MAGKRTRRRYTDDDRATALAVLDSNAGNLSRTARETGVPASTIKRWADDRADDLTELRDQKKEALSEVWDKVARAYLARALDPAVLKDTGGQSAITAAAIATDKLQLLEGKPTEVTEVRSSDAKRELADRIARLTTRPSGGPSTPN